MEQYIRKTSLVAEIKKKIRTEQGYSSGDEECRYRDCAKDILSFLDTLEVKEMDLEKEIDDAFLENKCNITDNVSLAEFVRIAKHFFELGLKTKGE